METPHKPNGNITIEVADDREDNRSEEEKEAEEDYQKQVVRQRKGTDEEARWVYKQKHYHYGYKKHCLSNVQGIVQKVITRAANRSDTKEFIPLLEGANIPQGTVVLADKGYASGENRSYLQTHYLQGPYAQGTTQQGIDAGREATKQSNQSDTEYHRTHLWQYSPVVSWRTMSIPETCQDPYSKHS